MRHSSLLTEHYYYTQWFIVWRRLKDEGRLVETKFKIGKIVVKLQLSSLILKGHLQLQAESLSRSLFPSDSAGISWWEEGGGQGGRIAGCVGETLKFNPLNKKNLTQASCPLLCFVSSRNLHVLIKKHSQSNPLHFCPHKVEGKIHDSY